TQVGRLYPANDGRRDGAYTIFYMGINLGAFLSPIVCGWLADNTVGGYHTGFTMAGIGMVIGLSIYRLGQPLIKEIDSNHPPVSNVEGTEVGIPETLGGEPTTAVRTAEGVSGVRATEARGTVPSPSVDGVAKAAGEAPLTEEEASRTPS